MGFSILIALFVMLTTAATLHAHGVKDIEASAQAAEALKPMMRIAIRSAKTREPKVSTCVDSGGDAPNRSPDERKRPDGPE